MADMSQPPVEFAGAYRLWLLTHWTERSGLARSSRPAVGVVHQRVDNVVGVLIVVAILKRQDFEHDVGQYAGDSNRNFR